MRSATLVLALAACGDGLPAPDASPPDTAGGWGLVSVHYHPSFAPDPSVPAGGRSVVFLGPDGAVVAATHTRDDGVASAFVPAGSSVTLFGPFGDVYSYLGVQPGDTIELGPPEAAVSRANEVAVSALRDPTALVYWLYDACWGDRLAATPATQGGTNLPIVVCDDGTTDLLLVGEHASLPGIYQYAPGVRAPAGGSLQFPGPYLPASTTVTVAFPPATAQFVEIQQQVFARGLLFDSSVYGNTVLALANDHGSVVAPVPSPANTIVATNVHDLGTFNRTGLKHAVVWGPAAARVDVDVSTGTVDSLVHPPALHGTTVAWQHTRDGVRPDFVRLALFTRTGTWDIAAPFAGDLDGNATLALPVLPPDLQPDLTSALVRSIAVIAGDSAADRHALLQWFPGAPWPLHEPSGRVVYETNNDNLAE